MIFVNQAEQQKYGGYLMYNIYKIDPNNLTTNEIENLYLVNKRIVKKYSLIDRFKDIDNYKDLFLSPFTRIDNELLILENNSLICGILNCIKSADWRGKELYKLTISLCDTIIDETILCSINQLIEEKLDHHGELAIITYNNGSRFPYQFMIGVKRSYRGRSLGKWLYASMYKRLFENVDFEKVLVCHHPDNIPAINISNWIGYKFNYLETIHVLYKQPFAKNETQTI